MSFFALFLVAWDVSLEPSSLVSLSSAFRVSLMPVSLKSNGPTLRRSWRSLQMVSVVVHCRFEKKKEQKATFSFIPFIFLRELLFLLVKVHVIVIRDVLFFHH
jgi:hypothetical protein